MKRIAAIDPAYGKDQSTACIIHYERISFRETLRQWFQGLRNGEWLWLRTATKVEPLEKDDPRSKTAIHGISFIHHPKTLTIFERKPMPK